MAKAKQTKKSTKAKNKAGALKGLLLEAVQFKQEYRVFSKGRKLQFRPGVNLIVGDQGCGKSSFLSLVNELTSGSEFRKEDLEKVAKFSVASGGRILSFDFEKSNPRTKGHFDIDGRGMVFQIQSKFVSHGETVKAIIASLANEDKPALILLDEPDMALSPRSAYWLAEQLQKAAEQGHQIIAAVHNPVLIESQDEVYSFEHKRWMKPQTFLAKHAESSGE